MKQKRKRSWHPYHDQIQINNINPKMAAREGCDPSLRVFFAFGHLTEIISTQTITNDDFFVCDKTKLKPLTSLLKI